MKRFTALLISLTLVVSLTSCGSSEDELVALYSSSDNVVNTDIGEFIVGQMAPLLTEEKLCYITEDQLSNDENLNCASAILINLSDNQLVQGQDIFKKVYPASLTKLMTAYVVFKYGNPDDMITISEDNCGITESGAQLIGFKKGDVISVKDLLYCLLVYSGNDAGTALAEYISGSEEEFCKLLSQEAKKLGCNNSNFVNPHGLHDENHYTSAYDTYIVLEKCMEIDLFREIAQTKDYEFSHLNASGEYVNKVFSTTNKFKLGVYSFPEDLTILGGKTGNTYSAGSCLIMHVADLEGKEYIVGIFGAPGTDSLYTQMQYLLGKISKISAEDSTDNITSDAI